MNKMTREKWIKYFIILAGIVLVAVLGSVFVNMGMDWFDSLTKPSEWIPNILIPIMWTIIYIAFAVYFYFAIREDKLSMQLLALLIANGILNVLWCLVFFTLNSLFVGLIVIVLNLIAGTVLLSELRKLHAFQFYLLLIYPLWLSIATTLNLALWILN